MKYNNILVLCIIASFLSAAPVLSFGEEEAAPKQADRDTQTSFDMQWLWGEVSSIDIQKGELSVQYLDYDTDQDKEVTVEADDKTTYENVSSLIDIKPGDTVSVDYLSFPDEKNVAKKISVEKPETSSQQANSQ